MEILYLRAAAILVCIPENHTKSVGKHTCRCSSRVSGSMQWCFRSQNRWTDGLSDEFPACCGRWKSHRAVFRQNHTRLPFRVIRQRQHHQEIPVGQGPHRHWGQKDIFIRSYYGSLAATGIGRITKLPLHHKLPLSVGRASVVCFPFSPTMVWFSHQKLTFLYLFGMIFKKQLSTKKDPNELLRRSLCGYCPVNGSAAFLLSFYYNKSTDGYWHTATAICLSDKFSCHFFTSAAAWKAIV